VTAPADTGQLTPVTTPQAPIPAPTQEPSTPEAVSTAPASGAAARTPSAVSTPADAASRARGFVDSLRSSASRGLTAPGGILLAILVLAPGVLMDLSPDGTFGLASSVTFVAAGIATALAVRRRALATAAVLPPLLFVGAVTVLAQLSGKNTGSREVVLDAGTTLAVSAPVLYIGTAATLAVVLARLLVGLVRR
jgi:hypothetical protein